MSEKYKIRVPHFSFTINKIPEIIKNLLNLTIEKEIKWELVDFHYLVHSEYSVVIQSVDNVIQFKYGVNVLPSKVIYNDVFIHTNNSKMDLGNFHHKVGGDVNEYIGNITQLFMLFEINLGLFEKLKEAKEISKGIDFNNLYDMFGDGGYMLRKINIDKILRES